MSNLGRVAHTHQLLGFSSLSLSLQPFTSWFQSLLSPSSPNSSSFVLPSVYWTLTVDLLWLGMLTICCRGESLHLTLGLCEFEFSFLLLHFPPFFLYRWFFTSSIPWYSELVIFFCIVFLSELSHFNDNYCLNSSDLSSLFLAPISPLSCKLLKVTTWILLVPPIWSIKDDF